MALESSSDRSENSMVICGAVIRSISKAKNATSATVTAAIAAIRAAPSDLTNSTSPCTDPHPGSAQPGKNCPVHGYCRVNLWDAAKENVQCVDYSITSAIRLSVGSTSTICSRVTKKRCDFTCGTF